MTIMKGLNEGIACCVPRRRDTLQLQLNTNLGLAWLLRLAMASLGQRNWVVTIAVATGSKDDRDKQTDTGAGGQRQGGCRQLLWVPTLLTLATLAWSAGINVTAPWSPESRAQLSLTTSPTSSQRFIKIQDQSSDSVLFISPPRNKRWISASIWSLTDTEQQGPVAGACGVTMNCW